MPRFDAELSGCGGLARRRRLHREPDNVRSGLQPHHLERMHWLPGWIARTDTVGWLDSPTNLCLARVFRRWCRDRGQTRPDMTEECPGKLNLEFLLHVLMFRASWQARNASAMAEPKDSLLRFRSPQATIEWLSTWPSRTSE